MALTTYMANRVWDHMFRNQAYTPPATIYIGLFTTAPTDAYTAASPTGVEVSGNGYARQAMALDAASARATQNTALEAFTAAGGAWGTVVAIGVFEALTGGEMMWWDLLDVSKTIGDGDTLEFAAGAVDMIFSAST